MTLSPSFLSHAQRVAAIEKKVAEKKPLNKKDLEFVAKIEKQVAGGRPLEGSQTLPVYNSMHNCEAATGIPAIVQRQAKLEGCDAFRFARVDLGKLLRFLFTERKEKPTEKVAGSSDGPEIPTTTDGWLKYWKARREKWRFEKDSEAVVSKDEVREGVQKALAEFYGALDRIFCTELPPILIGAADERTIRSTCKGEIDKLKARLKERFGQMALENSKEKGME